MLGYFLTALLFLGLGISLWFDRGLAFSPGPVTDKSQAGVTIEGYRSHADFEKQCGKCHDPLRSNLATKCLECHLDVNQQIKMGEGVHSQITTIEGCADCHPEHLGRNFDPTRASFQLFDHSKTSFSLKWHQENYDTTPMQCNACHQSTELSLVANQTCQDCHARHDSKIGNLHLQRYGPDCMGCHDGVDRMQAFDHSRTGFALDGKHRTIQCSECHKNKTVTDTPTDCQGCHTEPSIHQGLFNQACDTCHSTQAWVPVTLDNKPFGHFETASFSLALHQVDYANQVITCTTCHPQDLQSFDGQTCIDCHNKHDAAFTADHIQQFGDQCLACHDGVDRLSHFEHDNFFPLTGKHASIRCGDCHANQVFRGTPGECRKCHKEPEIHTGVFGLKCDYCHSAEAWSPATILQHSFPLNHGEEDNNAQLPCDTCHAASYVDYTCYNCHEHQQAAIEKSHFEEGISAQDLPTCVKCHPQGRGKEGKTSP